jgi:hypothetical protein
MTWRAITAMVYLVHARTDRPCATQYLTISRPVRPDAPRTTTVPSPPLQLGTPAPRSSVLSRDAPSPSPSATAAAAPAAAAPAVAGVVVAAAARLVLTTPAVGLNAARSPPLDRLGRGRAEQRGAARKA